LKQRSVDRMKKIITQYEEEREGEEISNLYAECVSLPADKWIKKDPYMSIKE
jgi:hypothetical protein